MSCDGGIGGQDSFSKKLRNSDNGKSKSRSINPRKSRASETSGQSGGKNEEFVGDFKFSESDDSEKEPVKDFKRMSSDPFYKISEVESEDLDSDKDAITKQIHRRYSDIPKLARGNQNHKSEPLIASLTKGLEQNSGIERGRKSDDHILLPED